jgi:UDP-glucose 4-epimerase
MTVATAAFLDRIGNASILITGGTGSFGTAFVERLLESGSGPILVFSRDESKQVEQRRAFPSPRLSHILGDVRDENAVAEAMAGIDYVFHAAALKQLPSCEFQPQEVLRTNVLGADVVMRCAERSGVKSVVLLSTDKAVSPVSTLGLTKALMEKTMIARARKAKTNTVLCCTRYGNVMGSRGSVIPLFIRQILEGGPITVTDPEMTRFMIPMDEAIDLILFALEQADSGDIFVRKSPATTIGTLVQALQTLFDSTVPVKSVGIRDGEKIHEALLTADEWRRAVDGGGVLRIRAEANPSRAGTSGEAYTSDRAQRLGVAAVAELLSRQPFVREVLAASGIELPVAESDGRRPPSRLRLAMS